MIKQKVKCDWRDSRDFDRANMKSVPEIKGNYSIFFPLNLGIIIYFSFRKANCILLVGGISLQ